MIDTKAAREKVRAGIRQAHSLVRRGARAAAASGIAVRLSIAFCAVAALAVAANIFVEQTTLVVRTTEVVQANQPQLQPLPPVRGIAQPAVTAPLPDLDSTVEKFVLAVLARVEKNTPQTTQQLTMTQQAYREAAVSYLAHGGPAADAASLTKIRRQLEALEKRAKEAIRIADSRREALQKYQDGFDRIDGRMRTSVDAALRLFGRVIARQSLIDLGRHLDDMRGRLARFAAPGGYSPADVQVLAASEAAFGDTLTRSERGLTRSQGAGWVKEMRENLVALGKTRASLVEIDTLRKQGTDALSRGSAELAKSVRAYSAHASMVASQAAEVQQVSAPLPQPQLQSSAATQPTKSTVQTSEIKDGTGNRALIASISAIVLLLLLLIAVGTVRSIVLPVRRLLEATRKLAAGQADSRVPRGGIRELDTLGIAFNRMADELSTAQQTMREYQTRLESKVEQRTRELQQLAQNDPLTTLPNRRQLFVLLNAAIDEAAKNNRSLGVLFLDLDNFKHINDSMGHAYGDQVLQAIAHRLRETAQRYGFAARLGGDEFTVVYAADGGSQAIHAAGRELVRAFQRPLLIEDRELIVSVSVGASIYPEHETSAAALLRAADVALFRAKALGRNQLSMFSPELLETAATRFATEQGLRRAIQRGEFELIFQPEYDAQTLQMKLVEALLRWRLPSGEYVPPAVFLPVAEESGLIMEISDYVLRAAIETAARWHHGAWPEARVAINISPRQLFDNRLPEQVHALLLEFKLPPRCIEIELTETVLQTGPNTIETLKALRALGVAVALDDFGTGYSSLASLEQLPLTRVKLDRSLIASIDDSARSQAIARAIVGLCAELGLEVTAEGIERTEQLNLLREYRGITLQGYLLSHPVPAREILENRRRDCAPAARIRAVA